MRAKYLFIAAALLLVGAVSVLLFVQGPKLKAKEGSADKGELSGADGNSPAAASIPAADVGGDVITNSIGMQLRLIQPGAFQMGSPEDEAGRRDDETPLHEVAITKPFYIGVYEVTQEQWTAVMGSNESTFVGPKRPVEQVSWNHTQAFLKKLSDKEGVEYRLPTEAEWEYACRAGTQTAYYWGDAWDDEYGWCESNSGRETHDVGMKQPNAWGLYDMSGNVWEWCQDWYDAYPTTPMDMDPQGALAGSYRVVRDGSWCVPTERCRSAARGTSSPEFRSNVHGFRVVRTP